MLSHLWQAAGEEGSQDLLCLNQDQVHYLNTCRCFLSPTHETYTLELAHRERGFPLQWDLLLGK